MFSLATRSPRRSAASNKLRLLVTTFTSTMSGPKYEGIDGTAAARSNPRSSLSVGVEISAPAVSSKSLTQIS